MQGWPRNATINFDKKVRQERRRSQLFNNQALPPEEKYHNETSFDVCTGLLSFATTVLLAQQKTPPLSPPATASATVGGKSITIAYNSPRVKGREGKIYTKDGLIAKSGGSQYPIWRGGANAATTLQTSADLTIGDLSVPAGTYTLFFDISDPANWTLIVSKATGEWGLAYDPSKDLGRTKMATSATPSLVEDLIYTITDNGGGNAGLHSTLFAWENMSASVPILVH